MREAYLIGHEPVFIRTGPLSKAEQRLLEQAQEPGVKARYTHYDCQVHGVFRIDNELGLDAPTCPRRRKECKVREVFDPAGYAEHYSMSNPQYQPDPAPAPTPSKLTPEQNRQLDEVLALANGPARDEETLRAEMERILGCPVSCKPQEMLDALREGLVGLPAPKPEPPQELGMPPAELRRRMEEILGVRIEASPEQLLEALRVGLICVDSHKSQRPESQEPEEEAERDPDDDLTDVELYASQMFTAEQICTILDRDFETESKDPDFLRQVEKGKLIQQSRVRSTIFMHARLGSAPAQTEALKLIRYAQIAAAGND